MICSWTAFVKTCLYCLCHISFHLFPYVEKMCNPGLKVFCIFVILLIRLTCVIRGLRFNSYFQVVCIGSFFSTSPIYGGPMEWESNLCIMLLLTLLLKDLVSLIRGVITLDSAKLRVILMMPQVEGMVFCNIQLFPH